MWFWNVRVACVSFCLCKEIGTTGKEINLTVFEFNRVQSTLGKLQMTTLQDKGPNGDGYYPLRDIPYGMDAEYLDGFGMVGQEKGIDGYYVGVATGEYRPPKKGEYFLSGAIVEVYQAKQEFATSYHIAKVVRVETENVLRITPIED